MTDLKFPAAVSEVPVRNVDEAASYYASCLGFTLDWGDDAGGIAGISRGDCRIFLSNASFRAAHGNSSPVVIWLNLGSREEVDELHRSWSGSGAKIVSPPESKPWNLHEFTAADLDGNLLRVFMTSRGRPRKQHERAALHHRDPPSRGFVAGAARFGA